MAPLPDSRALEFEVLCRTSSQSSGEAHAVSIRTDWSVDTGHDLEAERIAVALGAFRSCLDVVDRLVPAYRRALQLRLRVVPPGIRPGPHGWVLTDRVDECSCSASRSRPGLSLMSARSAAAHERSVYHLSRRFQVDDGLLGGLLAEADDAYGGLEVIPMDPDAARVVTEPNGLVELWDSGVHPQQVLRLHRELWPKERSIPARLYEAFGTHRSPAEWHRWTGVALQPLDIEMMVDSEFTPEDLDQIAQATGRTRWRVGTYVARWHRVACRPSPSAICELLRLPALDWPVPSNRGIELVSSHVGFGTASRAEIGLVLAVTGSTTHAIRAMREGARTPTDAYRYLETRGLA